MTVSEKQGLGTIKRECPKPSDAIFRRKPSSVSESVLNANVQEEAAALWMLATLKARAEHANRAMDEPLISRLQEGSLAERVARMFLIIFPTATKATGLSVTEMTAREVRRRIGALNRPERAECNFAIERAKCALRRTHRTGS